MDSYWVCNNGVLSPEAESSPMASDQKPDATSDCSVPEKKRVSDVSSEKLRQIVAKELHVSV